MHIIYPVIVGSNAMEVLSGDLLGGYTHLMEFRSNERLRRSFPKHQVGPALLGRDMRSEFLPGARLDVFEHGTTIVCLGVYPGMNDDIVQGVVSRLCEETPQADIVLLSMFREIPGVPPLWDAFVTAGVKELDWTRFSAMMRGEPLEETNACASDSPEHCVSGTELVASDAEQQDKEIGAQDAISAASFPVDEKPESDGDNSEGDAPAGSDEPLLKDTKEETE